MKLFKERISESLPKGSEIKEIYNDEDNQFNTIIEYLLDNTLYKTKLVKINLSPLFVDNFIVPFREDLTVKDVFDNINSYFDLGMVCGLDYPDDETKVNIGRNHFEISKYSIGYYGSIPVVITDPSKHLTSENTINKTVELEHFKEHLNINKIKTLLSTTVFSFEGKMFNKKFPSLSFREYIKNTLKEKGIEESTITEIDNGFFIKVFNDGLTDIGLLKTPNNNIYPIRFVSIKGDLPGS